VTEKLVNNPLFTKKEIAKMFEILILAQKGIVKNAYLLTKE
jgi:hypothetical protein